MQRVDFEFELVIADDCSTDGTSEIVDRYQVHNRGRVRVLARTARMGMEHDDVRAYSACRGDYIAWLDGDDYWTSEYKLQRQVDFLDNYPECAMCVHDTRVLNDTATSAASIRPSTPTRT